MHFFLSGYWDWCRCHLVGNLHRGEFLVDEARLALERVAVANHFVVELAGVAVLAVQPVGECLCTLSRAFPTVAAGALKPVTLCSANVHLMHTFWHM